MYVGNELYNVKDSTINIRELWLIMITNYDSYICKREQATWRRDEAAVLCVERGQSVWKLHGSVLFIR